MTLATQHDALLNAVEDLELLSLRWGDVDASLSLEDLEAIAGSLASGEAFDAGDTIETLLEAKLLFAVRTASGERFRSRFAELVRLLARARQTFMGESWTGSPPLVADFRIDIRARRYPRRDIGRDATEPSMDFSDLQKRIWRVLAPEALAGFQIRALRHLRSPPVQDRAVIVTAGTGSGKTLAFYLPAFLTLADTVRPGSFWTKAIAIYPRNELLKDQFTEAYRNAGRCSAILQGAGRRPLRLATFYGDTPQMASAESLQRTWSRKPSGFLCPFLKCDCGSDMVWTKIDLEAKRERLVCEACGQESDERLILTRNTALYQPPDILFTTTEMLNGSLSDQRRRALFGIAQPRERRPHFMLLDEAHSYSGPSGAQAALTLRRWRALTPGPLSWVGLSATLEEAPRFFSNLTGVDGLRVVEICPEEDEMVEEGREYQLALRGDPGSRASLLSTTIQAAMLIGRTLDPEGGHSEGRFGRRTFVFTDDLDVTHRLFHDLRDAEGFDRFGNPDPAREPLAVMRARVLPTIAEDEQQRRARDAAGQRWRMPEEVGRPLAVRLQIGKTTSGDPGVDARADLIVATSALEVGFNDPSVGAILQHKAPLSFASFLQRRGRAGRDRRMRPMTITVLSDYGRDRAAFQSFEHLFDPRLEPQHLPTGNQYILRMQAAFAFLDWIATRPRPEGVAQGRVWTTVSAPMDERFSKPAWVTHVRDTVGQVVKGDAAAIVSLSRHLRQALGIDDCVLQRLLWEPPRALLLDVAPTLARRILRDWKLAWPTSGQIHDAFTLHRPLPEAVPRTLFSDLDLPEVEVILPPTFQSKPEVREGMPIQQALSQLAPGRVTRRFGEAYGGLAHWSPVPPDIDMLRMPVALYAEGLHHLGTFVGTTASGLQERVVYRPVAIRLEKAAAAEIRPSSNATMLWASHFTRRGVPVAVATPRRTAWRGVVAQVNLFSQSYDAGVTVGRFAYGAFAEVRRASGVEQLVDVDFVDDVGRPAAVGYEFETDGLVMTLTLPSAEDIAGRGLDAPAERGVKAALLRHLIHTDRDLPRSLNVFQRAWLRQIHLLSAAGRALTRGGSLADAVAALALEGGLAHYDHVMDALLGAQRSDVAALQEPFADEDETPRPTARTGRDRLERLKGALRDRLSDAAICRRLDSLVLNAQTTGASRTEFVRKTLEHTLGQATLAACVDLAPRQAVSDALIVDLVEADTGPRHLHVWVSETTVGGAGVLAAIAETIAREPRTLFRAMEAALEPSDLEQAAAALARSFRLVASSPDIATAVADVRRELGHGPRAAARKRLLAMLETHGVQTGRAFAVSLGARMLAPGLTSDHDRLINLLLDFWDRIETRLGIEFEPREVAVLALDDASIVQAAMSSHLFAAMTPTSEKAMALTALLWPRSRVMGRDALASRNPFSKGYSSDPVLVRALLLEANASAIDLETEGWADLAVHRLTQDGVTRVDAPLDRGDLVRQAMVRLPAMAIAIDTLKLYPALERIARDDTRLSATFVLKEQI